jgi:hypothetical protein
MPETPDEGRVYDSAELDVMQRSRAEADVLRSEMVERMNAERPTPEYVMTYTPTGPVTEEVHTAVSTEKNQEIDQQIQDYKEWVERSQGMTRDEFNRVTEQER